MTPAQQKANELVEILNDTMAIIEAILFVKCENSELKIETPADQGWYHFSEATAKKLKRQLVKYKTRG